MLYDIVIQLFIETLCVVRFNQSVPVVQSFQISVL